MSIIRVGLAETQDFSDGWDRIFGKKDETAGSASEAKAEEKQPDAPTCSTPSEESK
jgi:hypothetical protein